MSVTLYLALSQDGYTADEKGGVKWLEYAHSSTKEDYGYSDFLESIDVIVMGEVSYKKLIDFSEWPYAGKKTYVFSHRMNGSCEEENDIVFVSGDVKEVLEKIKLKNPESNIWLFGGANLIDQFYKQQLIDKYILTVVPLDLKSGIQLCKEILKEHHMKLVDTILYPKDIKQKFYIAYY